MNSTLVTILCAVLGSSGLISGIFSIINTALVRKAEKNDKTEELRKEIEEVRKKAEKNEVGSVRLQILVMMADYPNDTSEILRVSEHYFKDLKGNWYLTSIFNRWLEDNEIAKPEWFNNSNN